MEWLLQAKLWGFKEPETDVGDSSEKPAGSGG